MTQRILVGTDGSEESNQAVQWCTEFALANTGVEVIACHVVSTFGEWLLSIGQVDYQKVEEEHRHLLAGPWTEPLRAAGVAYDVEQTTGDPAKQLLAVADERDVDLIVVGKSGHGAAGDLVLGSTAAKLTHRTTRPLLVVPRRRAEHPPVHEERHVPIPG